MNRSELQKLLLDTFGVLDDKQLMGLTIYGEARGEGHEGMIAQGSVILERVDHRNWDGNTIQEVCLMPYQFSCYLPADPNYIALKLLAQTWDEQYKLSSTLRNCYGVASGLIDGTIPRTPEIAAHHVCQYVTVAWRKQLDEKAVNENNPESLKKLNEKRWWMNMTLITVIGHHGFYA